MVHMRLFLNGSGGYFGNSPPPVPQLPGYQPESPSAKCQPFLNNVLKIFVERSPPWKIKKTFRNQKSKGIQSENVPTQHKNNKKQLNNNRKQPPNCRMGGPPIGGVVWGLFSIVFELFFIVCVVLKHFLIVFLCLSGF